MVSAVPKIEVGCDCKKSKTSSCLSLAPSHHSSMSSLSRSRSIRKHAGHQSITISIHPGGTGAYRNRRCHDSCSDGQQRRFLFYLDTILLITGLFLIIMGAVALILNLKTIGLALIGIGVFIYLIKAFTSERVFWSLFLADAHPAQVPPKIPPLGIDENAATPLANVSEFPVSGQDTTDSMQKNMTPASPPSRKPETHVFIGNDSGEMVSKHLESETK